MADNSNTCCVDVDIDERAKVSIMTKGSRSVIFPVRLHFILEEVERRGLTDVVSWLPGGTAFKIHKRAAFIDKVLKKYFNTDSYKSFQRNLHLYGFHTVPKGRNKGVMSHPQFVRGDPSRCSTLPRMLVKGKRICHPTKMRSRLQQRIEQTVTPETMQEQLQQSREHMDMVNELRAGQQRQHAELQRIQMEQQELNQTQQQPQPPPTAATAEPTPEVATSGGEAAAAYGVAMDEGTRNLRREAIAGLLAAASTNMALAPELRRRAMPVAPATMTCTTTTATAEPQDAVLQKSCTESLLVLAQAHRRERQEVQDQMAYLQLMMQQQVERQAEQKRQLLEKLTLQLGPSMVAHSIESLLEFGE